jgi:hypothetical protein
MHTVHLHLYCSLSLTIETFLQTFCFITCIISNIDTGHRLANYVQHTPFSLLLILHASHEYANGSTAIFKYKSIIAKFKLTNSATVGGGVG